MSRSPVRDRRVVPLDGDPQAQAGGAFSQDVDVVVVSYNQRERLRAACESALAGSVAARVIVVDNHSSDGSADAVRDLLLPGDLIEMDSNKGFGAAANVGIARGIAPFVLLLNHDARLRSDSLEILLEAARDPIVGALGPRLVSPEGVIELTTGRTMSPVNEAMFKLFGALYRDGRGLLSGWVDRHYGKSRWTRSLSAACLLLRRETLAQVGGFDERFFMYAEDVDLCRRLTGSGWRIRYVAEATVEHERSVGLREKPEQVALAYRRSQMAFYRKHSGTLAANGLRVYLMARYGIAALVLAGDERGVARSLLRWTLHEAGQVR